jgi:hypothetical protein
MQDELLFAAPSARTRRRWQAHGIPARVRASAGDLGAIDDGWRGWRLIRGELVSPEGWKYRPGELYALPILRERVRALERETRPGTQRDLF